MTRTLLSLGSALAVLVTASSAHAATVTVRANPDSPSYDEVHVVAAPGETNRLLITPREDAKAVRVHDAGAALQPGEHCAAVDARTVLCSARDNGEDGRQWLARARVEAGDGDDEVVHSGRFAVLIAVGGPGDDRLVGGRGNDRLSGGGGRDELYGNEGYDELSDGDISGASGELAPGPDVLDGGGGALVSYEQRTAAVTVDISDPEGAGGEAGEGDVVRGVSHLVGGQGNDRLVGNDEGNRLRGLGGRDRLLGHRGDDELNGGTGRDSFSCGSGLDVVRDVRRHEKIQRACERVEVIDRDLALMLTPHAQTTRNANVLRFPGLRCGWSEEDDSFSACTAKYVLRDGRRRLLARGTLRRTGDADQLQRVRSMYVRLTPLGRRLARRGVHATVSVGGENFPSGGWITRLKTRR